MRKLSLLLIVLMVLIVGGSASAQDGQFCGTLSAEDCALLYGTSANVPSAASFNANIDISFSNLPDSTPSEGAISIAVTGAYAGLDMTAMDGLSTMDATALDAAAVTELVTALPGLLRSFDGALTLSISIPPELAQGVPSELVLDLLLVDGFGYINFDTLAALIPPDATGGMQLAGWGGLDIAGLVEQLGPLLAQSFDPAALGDLAGGATGGATGTFSPDLIQTITEFSTSDAINAYITLERGEDMEGMAVFYTTVDFQALAADPTFMDIVMQVMAESGTEMTEEDMADVQMVLPAIFSGLTFEQATVIDPATGYFVGGSFDVVFDGPTVQAAAIEMGATAEEVGELPNLAISAFIEYGDINTATVSVPEGAQVLPLDQLGALLGGGF